jgi:cobalamin synthase
MQELKLRRKKPISKGKKESSKSMIIFGNLTLILWIVLGTLACLFFYLLVAWCFAVLSIVLVYHVLRKRCCKTCYYCETCTLGFGKLPELFFGKSGTENVTRSGLKMFPFVYGLLSLLPMVLLIISFAQELVIFKFVIIFLLLFISLYSGIIRRKILVR